MRWDPSGDVEGTSPGKAPLSHFCPHTFVLPALDLDVSAITQNVLSCRSLLLDTVGSGITHTEVCLPLFSH